MRRLSLLAPVVLALTPLGLAGCATTNVPAGPGTVASSTVLDEKAAIGVETAYTAAARAAALAIRSSVVTDKATIARIGALDRNAYIAVQAVRAAYNAGNAPSYAEAFNTANTALRDLLSAL